MGQETTHTSVSEYIMGLLGRGYKREQVEAELLQKGHEAYFVKQIVQETINLRNSKARAQALIFILCGAALCLISCIITMGSSLSHSSFSMVLYGLTSIGIILVFAGLAKIF
jgi:hypothetical protein